MRHIQNLFIEDRANAPLLHRQCAKEDLDRFSIFVATNLIDYVRMRGNWMPLHVCLKESDLMRLPDTTAKPGTKRLLHDLGLKMRGHFWDHVGVASAGIEER